MRCRIWVSCLLFIATSYIHGFAAFRVRVVLKLEKAATRLYMASYTLHLLFSLDGVHVRKK